MLNYQILKYHDATERLELSGWSAMSRSWQLSVCSPGVGVGSFPEEVSWAGPGKRCYGQEERDSKDGVQGLKLE